MQRTEQIIWNTKRMTRHVAAWAALTLLAAAPVAALEPLGSLPAPAAQSSMTEDAFLDRLMQAESGGRDTARNPLSTAVGPYQFINQTFLDVVRRHFAEETATLTVPQILALRTDRTFARRAARIYTAENAKHLAAAGLSTTYPNLRLAFLVGAAGAVRILQAPPQESVAALLGPAVIQANPFMQGLTAAALVARSARDLKLPATDATVAALSTDLGKPAPASGTAAKKPTAPKLVIQCNLDLPSCRRWVALHSKPGRTQPAQKRIKAAALN